MRLLICMLDFDDLLQPPAVTLQLDGQPTTLVIARGGDGEPLGFPSAGELHVPDRFLSTRHAVMVHENGVDSIRDEGSRNGTWVDGERVTEKALTDGALIEVGHTLFCYRKVELPVDENLKLGPVRTLCPELHALVRDLERVGPSTESVLIVGEAGCGKEIVAEMIHRLSGRRGELCAVDCSAVPDTLFEATFFGHKRGTIIGAEEGRQGEIARAEGGTLFLDEVGKLSAEAQAKLLGAIESGGVTPLGGEPRAVDVRWVAATSREPGAECSDLVRRLMGYVARVPPLRSRREDLGLLAAHFLKQAGVTRASITVPAARQLFCGPLEGNVRELRQTLRTASLLAVGEIRPEHLPAYAAREEPETRKLAPGIEEVEAALQVTEGNIVQAARRLGTTGRQLSLWIEKFEIDLAKFR